MRDGRQIAEFIEERIGRIIRRPLMYGSTPEGVDNILGNYHEVWAVIHEREDEFRKLSVAFHESEGCDSANFAYHYRRAHPAESEDDAARYVVSMWLKIGEGLGLSTNELHLG